MVSAKELAKQFHNIYEEKARESNWNTQENCRVEFEDLPLENQNTMIRTCRRILKLYHINKK